MKQFYYCFVLLILLLPSCRPNKDVAPYFEKEEIVFTGTEVNAPREVKIIADGEWDISDISVDWFSITPMQGVGNGVISIQMDKYNNTGSERRSEVMVLALGHDPSILKIVQNATDENTLTDGMLNNTKEGYYKEGKPAFVFDVSNMQLAIRPALRSFRIVSDNQQQVLVMTLDSAPEKNKEVDLIVQSKGLSIDVKESMTYIVYKISGDKVWLYNIGERKGFIVRYQKAE